MSGGELVGFPAPRRRPPLILYRGCGVELPDVWAKALPDIASMKHTASEVPYFVGTWRDFLRVSTRTSCCRSGTGRSSQRNLVCFETL
jgi:hypothetical protein